MDGLPRVMDTHLHASDRLAGFLDVSVAVPFQEANHADVRRDSGGRLEMVADLVHLGRLDAGAISATPGVFA
ncbi:MAG: hypothetical protein Q9157_001699 [Trypethelium eluteriae]